jgi:hypothetical protein
MSATTDEGGPATLTARHTRLAAALEEWSRRTLRLEELWAVYSKADPSSAGSPQRRTDLADALAALSEAGLVTLSSTIDRSAKPYLPTRVTLPAAAPSPSAGAMTRATAWRPELAWAATARLSVAQVLSLRAVNVWLRDRGRDDDVVPLRERSLEVFGHEKILDRQVTTSLFGPGRLTLAMLRTFRSHPPMPATRVGDGPTLLVIENEDTFTSIVTCAKAEPYDLGWVAWGAGGAFEASVRSVADLNPAVTAVRYFGDIDFDGLRIPASAAATALRENLPAVTPAIGLYTQLIEHGTPQPGQAIPEPGALSAARAWLLSAQPGDTVEAAVLGLLSAGHRLPQEAVGLRLLRHAGCWRGY